MRYLSILPVLLITATLWGQQPDQKRMKRDIAVAEKIIDALLEEVNPKGLQSYRIEGTYLDSYGILFTFSRGVSFFPRAILGGQNKVKLKETTIPMVEDGVIQGYAITEDDDEFHLSKENFQEVTETFLSEYGHLLTQLPSSERICLKYTESKGGFFGLAGTDFFPARLDDPSSKPGFTAVVQQKVVQEHRKGNINKATLVNQIEYSESKAINSETDRELIILNSIFTSAYQKDVSEDFYIRGKGNVEKIVGLGALFSYSFLPVKGTRGLASRNLYYHLLHLDDDVSSSHKQALREKLKKMEEEEEQQQEEGDEVDFDQFLADFKTNVIEYGSTVKKLKDEEVLSFELHFPSCKECDDRPGRVKITAKQALLNRYRMGKIDLDDAIEELVVTY